MRRAALFVLLFLLAACAGQQPVFRPVTVDVPVGVPCKAAPVPKPDFPLSHVAVTGSLFEKVKAALVELDRRKAYEARLKARLSACQ